MPTDNRVTRTVRRVNDFMNKPIYQPPVRQGNAGGGVVGGLNRGWREFARETVANTPGEAISGGLFNPVRGLAAAGRAMFQGSTWNYNRGERRGEYGPLPPGMEPAGSWNRGGNSGSNQQPTTPSPVAPSFTGPPEELGAYNNHTPATAFGPSERPRIMPFALIRSSQKDRQP
jgi:hypothetical protein